MAAPMDGACSRDCSKRSVDEKKQFDNMALKWSGSRSVSGESRLQPGNAPVAQLDRARAF